MATFLEPNARQQLDDLPKPIQRRMRRLLERLDHWPAVSGVKSLSGNRAGKFRLRTGDYRLQFRIEGEDVIVEKIGHRATFYED